MRLERLNITLDEYGANKGKYVGSANFKGSYGSVEIVMTPQLSDELLRICADALVANARDVAQNLTAQIIEQGGQKMLADHNPNDLTEAQ